MPSNGFCDKLETLSLDSTHRIVVGVDYGTTFTGACYADTQEKDRDNITLINTWPGPTRDAMSVLKTPSRIAYSADNPRIESRRWGYQVEPGMIAYSWTKLLFDRGICLTDFDDPALEGKAGAGMLRLPDGKTAVDVAADYLSEVYKHILASIARKVTDESLSSTPLEFWFTVPAIWSDQARNATRTAAQRAGFGNGAARPNDKIFMISEPEAAAVMALKKYAISGIGGAVKSGDGVLVCDCGGGTVDITTYRVEQTSPLTFEELCTGNGGKCGSTMVDRNFHQLMSARFGDAFDSLPVKRKGPGSEFMKKFDSVKRDFGYSNEPTTYELPLKMSVSNPNPEHFDEEESVVILSDDDLQSILDPVVGQIVNLVGEQIRAANDDAGSEIVNRIILVGGFGDSVYLLQALRELFGSTGKIAITVPDDPQAAVVQGAALCGLQGLHPSSKRCRRHYGYGHSRLFQPGVDNISRTYRDDYSGQLFVKDLVDWTVEKGKKHTDDYTHTTQLTCVHYASRSLKKPLSLYACDLNCAPGQIDSAGVYLVGKVIMDFNDEDISQFEHKYVSGELVYRLTYQLHMFFDSQKEGLRFEARCGGKPIGKTTVNFNTRGLLL